MDTTFSTIRKLKRMFVNILSIFVILTIAFSTASIVHAVGSPFVGQWQAKDVDGSDIRLAIAGRPNGPFQITWTESYISFCNREAGIVRGTGWLNESDPNLLEADLHLECFTTRSALDFHLVWRYHPATDMLSSWYANGSLIVWDRPVQMNRTNLAALITAAQAEGSLTVIALPNDWCNFGAIIDGFTETYGIAINSVSPGVSSAEELQAIRDGIENPSPDTPDVIDVGPGFALQAQSERLITPYQVSTWNTIPDSMKDSEGYWYGDYYGVMSIAVNTAYSAKPSSWEDLRSAENIEGIALGGDPTVSNMGFFAVYGASLANGGSLNNIEPGLQFFKELQQTGRLLSNIGNGETLASGETPILLEWSYLALAQRDTYSDSQIEVIMPQPGSIANFYAQAINAYAPHPNAARLWMEYLYSDVSQLAFLQGYCFPARFDDLLVRGIIPANLLAGLPDIAGVDFPSVEQVAAAKAYVEAHWACTMYGGCQ